MIIVSPSPFTTVLLTSSEEERLSVWERPNSLYSKCLNSTSVEDRLPQFEKELNLLQSSNCLYWDTFSRSNLLRFMSLGQVNGSGYKYKGTIFPLPDITQVQLQWCSMDLRGDTTMSPLPASTFVQPLEYGLQLKCGSNQEHFNPFLEFVTICGNPKLLPFALVHTGK